MWVYLQKCVRKASKPLQRWGHGNRALQGEQVYMGEETGWGGGAFRGESGVAT